MSEERLRVAVKATAQSIADDDAHASRMGADSIPADEVIIEAKASDYVSPDYLRKTAPSLAGAFGELLEGLRDLNALLVGERTVEAQAYLSLTGDHEELEQRFLGWCQHYFAIRGDLGRLNPSNGGDPWQLYLQCMDEFGKLLDRRVPQPGTINSSVLNLTQRFMLSGFAAKVLTPDLKSYASSGRDRFGSTDNRLRANQRVGQYNVQLESFTTFFETVGQNLPAEYAIATNAGWAESVREKVTRRAEDISFLRYVLCKPNFCEAETQKIAPELWGRFDWDVYHGGSIGVVLTSASAEQSSERTTRHLLSVRRDGWLSNREYGWICVDPDYKTDERGIELAVNWFLLDTLTAKLEEAWLRIDPEPIISRGLEPDATEEEQTAALAVALAEPEAVEQGTPIKERVRLPRLRLTRIKKILTSHFECEWSKAKGSEQKVYRDGSKNFTFGCHGKDRVVHPVQLQKCLVRLQIPTADFILASR
jgi:hypothetical protein